MSALEVPILNIISSGRAKTTTHDRGVQDHISQHWMSSPESRHNTLLAQSCPNSRRRMRGKSHGPLLTVDTHAYVPLIHFQHHRPACHPTIPYASVYPWALLCSWKETTMQCICHRSYLCAGPSYDSSPRVQLDELNRMTFHVHGQTILLLAPYADMEGYTRSYPVRGTDPDYCSGTTRPASSSSSHRDGGKS